MIEYYEQLKTIAFTALFNPAFLGLLLILFFVGRIFGKLTKNIRLWKILVLGYFALFLYAPVRDAGPILGGIFIAGMLSNHVRTFFSVLFWAGNVRDVIFAFKYRSAYEDIRRREQELEERERSLREAELRQAYRQEQGQKTHTGWQQEARNFRQKPEDKTQDGSSGNRQSRSSQNQGQNKRSNTSQTPPSQSDVRARHLEILGLKPGRAYSAAELKKAYRRKMMKVHPDVGGSSSDFIVVQTAYTWLRT